MITSIKKIKDIGVFKDFETRRTGLQKDFCKKNFVYSKKIRKIALNSLINKIKGKHFHKKRARRLFKLIFIRL